VPFEGVRAKLIEEVRDILRPKSGTGFLPLTRTGLRPFHARGTGKRAVGESVRQKRTLHSEGYCNTICKLDVHGGKKASGF